MQEDLFHNPPETRVEAECHVVVWILNAFLEDGLSLVIRNLSQFPQSFEGSREQSCDEVKQLRCSLSESMGLHMCH